jgi:hypothetical protein
MLLLFYTEKEWWWRGRQEGDEAFLQCCIKAYDRPLPWRFLQMAIDIENPYNVAVAQFDEAVASDACYIA